mgnify:FL=1
MTKKRNLGKELITAVREINAGGGREFTVEIPYNIKYLRANMGLSQEEFALRFNISVRTLQKWEQGERKPTGPAISLLKIASKYPFVFLNKDPN